jgi:uncharacterized peroxidase-related enzyme
MSLLTTVSVKDAKGRIKEIYDEIENIWGYVPKGMELWSVNEEAFQMHWSAIKRTMSKSEEDRKLYTMIRFLVSDKNSCSYCSGMNEGILINHFGVNKDALLAMKDDVATAPLSQIRKLLLIFAVKSIENPDAIGQNDINGLKYLGLKDSDIFEAVRYAGYMSLVNTLFRTFKVEKD